MCEAEHVAASAHVQNQNMQNHEMQDITSSEETRTDLAHKATLPNICVKLNMSLPAHMCKTWEEHVGTHRTTNILEYVVAIATK